jgi:hypothetical protein
LLSVLFAQKPGLFGDIPFTKVRRVLTGVVVSMVIRGFLFAALFLTKSDRLIPRSLFWRTSVLPMP